MHQVLEIIEESSDSAGPDLITLDDLKLALGITGNTEDAALQSAITFQSRIIAEYCNRRFGMAQALETFTFDPYEYLQIRQPLVLSLYPVAQISEVSTAGATAADWHFDPPSGRLWLTDPQNTGFYTYGYPPYSYWPGSVMVSYSGGYDLPEGAPARLQRAVIEAVNLGRISATTRDPTIREVQHGDTRISYATAAFATGSSGYLSASVTDLINPFRRLYIP
jgi:hypothetical protein